MSAKTRKRHKAPSSDQTGASPEILVQLLDKLQRENARLEAKLKNTNPQDELLVDISLALLLGSEATHPGRSTPTDGDRRSSPETPLPGAHVAAASHHYRTLRSQLFTAVDRFNRAAAHLWHPPRPPKEAKMRCRNRSCEAVDKRIPKYVGPRDSGRIELIRCPKCDSPLTVA